MKEFEGVNVTLWAIGLIACWFFTRNAESFTWSLTGFAIICWTGAFSISELSFWVSRYKLGKVVVDDYNGSYSKDKPPVVYGKWVIASTGYSLFPFPQDGKLATVIIPKKNVVHVGKNLISNSFVKKTHINNLPPNVCRWLKVNKDSYNTDNIYFGDFSKEILFSNPKIADMKEDIEYLWQEVNRKQDLLDKHNDMIVAENQKAKELVGDQGFIDKIKRKIEEMKKDED